MLVFWVVKPCGLKEEHTISTFWTEDGGSMFFRNVGIYLQVHTAVQPRRPTKKKKRTVVKKHVSISSRNI
jgi:hypothetical protein